MMKWHARTSRLQIQQDSRRIKQATSTYRIGEPQDCFGAPEEAEPSGKKSGLAKIMELTILILQI